MGQRCPKVLVVHVDGLRFVTVEADDPIWTASSLPATTGARFVRLRPPTDVTEQRIEEVVRHLASAGADVQVLARPRAKVNVEDAVTRFEDKSIRETVEELVRDANTRDRPALSELVQRKMAEVKL